LNDDDSSDERRRNLAEQIAREEQHISEIDAELEHRRAVVSSFKEQLAAIEPRAVRPTALEEVELPRFGGQVRACGRGNAPVLLFIPNRAFIVQG